MVVPAPISARATRNALDVAEQWLAINREGINAINVYPVPDGDTGTNMLATWRAALSAAPADPDHAGELFAELSRGALLGARGNSGVILSQMIRGMAQALVGRESVDTGSLCEALRGASDIAYAALSNPVEGTMLTVMREAADAAERSAEDGSNTAAVLSAAVDAAFESVQRTPDLLPALRDAGVVDAGGMGVAVLLQGTTSGLMGTGFPEQAPVAASEQVDLEQVEHEGHGYCTEFLVEGSEIDLTELERELEEAGGDSILVVGTPGTARVHVHIVDPGPALSAGARRGALDGVKVENMQAQHDRWAEDRARGAADGAAVRDTSSGPATLPALGLVAVAPGAGIAMAFRELGAAQVLVTAETGKASAGELLDAARQAGRDHVVLLPNDKDILMAAEQAAASAEGFITVVPTRHVPAGLAAAVAYMPDGPRETIIEEMREAAEATRCVEVSTAVRDATVDGVTVREGEAIVLVGGRMAASAPSVDEALMHGLREAGLAPGELVTLYLGLDADPGAGDRLTSAIEQAHPGVEVEVIDGQQPYYPCIAGIE